MNTSTRLDSAVFQLTPTRTRFDLVITVNGKKEKISSGLLNPFLSHLRAAQDQMDKGGYSIVLEPEGNTDTSWFTKGTVERFVRFVSTPEILERVYTIESEILQIEEAIAIQGNSSLGISTVEENQVKHVESTEGISERTSRKTQQDTNEERAIVLYKPDSQPPQANGSITSEGNSKVHLLKVLETRKSALQKEQGMAFARAVAAGFDIDNIPALMSFTECFGASRMKDACTKFWDLWRRKHETGQWLEIEAAETMSNRSDFSGLNSSGIIFPNMAPASHTELDCESNGKASSDVPPMDRQPSAGNQDNIQGQFPHHMFPPWPVHSPPGAVPVFQPYPVQGIPYYQPYPGNSPFMQPNYSPMEDPRIIAGQSNRHRRHSMDSRHSNTESETWDEASKSRLQDEVDTERSHRRKKDRQSGQQKSGMVVIRNINYITKAENSSGSGSYSDSASETDEDNQESVKISKRRESRKESLKKLDSSDREETENGKDVDGGHWQAFQNCLLRDVDEDRHAIDQDQYDLEKVNDMRRKKHIAANDPLDFNEREMHEVQGSSAIDMHSYSKGPTRMSKASNDELLLSARAGQFGDGGSVHDVQSLEVNGKGGGYRRATGDDFVISKQGSEFGNAYPSSDIETTLVYSNNKLDRKLFHDMNDDSYILEHRSLEVNNAGNVERNAIDMDSEIPMMHQREEKSSDEINRINYEPDELSMLPERGAERGTMSYDPALDYEMQAQAGGSSQNKNKEAVADTKPGSKRLDKEPKSKLTPNSSDKRKTGGPIRRGKTSRNPLDEARARAESLRNYKADLQKMKKEKEEEELKRLEALKMERQKRIAAKGSSMTAQSPSQLTKKQLPIKPLPSSHKGSKFSDSEPGPSLPLQRFPVRTASVGSNDSLKAPKTSRLISKSHLDNNKLSRSVSSLPESKPEMDDSTTDTKASMARIRRLSEPKMSTSIIRQTSSVKPNGTGTVSKTKAADGPESKKISAIVNHDKSKTAALPELKIRTSKASDTPQNRTSVKEKVNKSNVSNSFMKSEGTMPKKNEIGISSNDDGDDNPVVEKTVVVLECEKPYAPPIHNSEENFGISKKQYDNEVMEKTGTASTYVAIRAPGSPLSMDIIDKETSEAQSHPQPISTISTEVKMNNKEKEPSKSSSLSVAGETYHAPYARVSSMEDPSTRNSEYAKAAPTSFETGANGTETVKAHVSNIGNSTLEKIPEAIEKPQVKESSSKGFRRLLKFGKKSHSSAAERNTESDNASIDGTEADEIGTNGSSNEVHTLKNLISQDETPTASTTQQKSSRSFSLLSPFRSKNSEKKIMMA